MTTRVLHGLRNALAALGLLWILVSVSPLTEYWTLWLAGPWQSPKGNVLVLLGGDDMGPQVLGYSSYLRAYHALRLWRDGGLGRILITGRSVSRPMRDFLVHHGVPTDVIDMDEISESTFQNVTEARLRLGQGESFVLVSSDYHMRRAAAVFRRQGLFPVTAPAPDALKRIQNWRERWPVIFVLFNEQCKLHWYQWKGLA
jgi:uncharacterized SAM-binding protein YcdF (DUF218 family)